MSSSRRRIPSGPYLSTAVAAVPRRVAPPLRPITIAGIVIAQKFVRPFPALPAPHNGTHPKRVYAVRQRGALAVLTIYA